MRKALSFALCVIIGISAVFSFGEAQTFAVSEKYTADELIAMTAQSGSYDEFLLNSAYDAGTQNIVLNTEDAEADSGTLMWNTSVDTESRYYIKIRYRALTDSLSDSQCSLYVNENIQYNELSGFALQREYSDKEKELYDIYGNQITPEQHLSYEETVNYAFDYAGLYAQPLSVNLEKGSNTVKLAYYSDEIEILSIILVPAKPYKDYGEYINENSNKPVYGGGEIYTEAENAYLKSDTVLYPLSNKSSPDVSPSAVGKIVLNTIGGNNWKKSNQYIKWNVEVPEDGMYTLTLKFKQNRNVGEKTRRAVYINGEIPFKEAASIAFDYSSEWQTCTLGNGDESFLFFLVKGKNEIKLQATLGEGDKIVRAVDNCVTELNAVYRRLLVILGSEPDAAKDYKLDKNAPDVIEGMAETAKILDSAAELYEKTNGKKNSASATLQTLSRQLKKMKRDSDKIPSEFSYFKTNIGSLGTAQASVKQQPLEIDYFVLGSKSPKLLNANSGFLRDFVFGFKEFICSFVIDYKNIGSLENVSENSKAITVWITSGRDQSQTLRNLISEDFTPKTGNRVKLELVTAASLLPATVAGIGPDVSVGVSSASVIDYSMRNAAYNLKEFEDYESFSQNFYTSSFIPLQYMGGVYAIPMSIAFNVLYYRKDILSDLGLKVPETWNDVVAMSSVLSVNNMSFGLPSGNQTFLMMLRQRGLEVYNSEASECMLDSADAIDVFTFYTNFYNNYGFPITYSLVNRFRTGETPIAVDSITMYNNLEISAPEIKGLWDFTVVPGFENSNGTDNTTLLSGTATMLLKNTSQPQAGWEFIKWWSSAEIQTAYGKEIESRLGSSGRYTSANKNALNDSCWSRAELATILKQLESTSAIEQVPGGYYLARNLDNAFRNAVYYNKKPMDVMFDYVYKINGELTEKRKELGITGSVK